MTKEELITVLQTVVDALKNTQQPEAAAEQQVVEVPVQTQQPATSWDIIRQNQQQLAALQQELSNLKMGVNAQYPMLPQPGMNTLPQMQSIINPNNIGGNFQ